MVTSSLIWVREFGAINHTTSWTCCLQLARTRWMLCPLANLEFLVCRRRQQAQVKSSRRTARVFIVVDVVVVVVRVESSYVHANELAKFNSWSQRWLSTTLLVCSRHNFNDSSCVCVLGFAVRLAFWRHLQQACLFSARCLLQTQTPPPTTTTTKALKSNLY